MSLSLTRHLQRSHTQLHVITSHHRRKQSQPCRSISLYDFDFDESDVIPVKHLKIALDTCSSPSPSGTPSLSASPSSCSSSSPSPTLSSSSLCSTPTVQYGMLHVESHSSPLSTPLISSPMHFIPTSLEEYDEPMSISIPTYECNTQDPISSPISTTDESQSQTSMFIVRQSCHTPSTTPSPTFAYRSRVVVNVHRHTTPPTPSRSIEHQSSTSTSTSPSLVNRSSSSNSLNAVGKRKICGSCGTKNTPYWRDGWNGICLCNACGIRYKKRRLACSHCLYVPRKDERGEGNCSKCQLGVFTPL